MISAFLAKHYQSHVESRLVKNVLFSTNLLFKSTVPAPAFLSTPIIRNSFFLQRANLGTRDKFILSFSSRTQRGKFSRCVTIIRASGQKPPVVKSSFYRNPSKAIEKGGGFYFPGLHGPRLRVFVAIVALSLLSINHVASMGARSASSRSFIVAEAISLAAAGSVALSAYLDFDGERSSDDIDENETASDPSSAAVLNNGVVQTASDETLEEFFSWTGNVAMDLTPVDSFVVFEGERVAYASSPFANGRRGMAVSRVAAENKALYVSDSRTLPKDVGFPFLAAGGSEGEGFVVYMVPALSGRVVAVFSTRCGAGNELSARDRLWLRQCVERIEKVWP